MVLVYIESPKGKLKKAAFEAVTYGKKLADSLSQPCVALTFGAVDNAAQLGKYGASKVYNVADAAFAYFDSQVFAKAVGDAADQLNAKTIILCHTSTGKAITGRLAARFEAGSVSGANAVPSVVNGFVVRKSVFSGKAIAEIAIKSDLRIISLMGNSIQPEISGADVEVSPLQLSVAQSRIRVKSVKIQEGTVPLPEAELVVSAGRGLKGPENWGMVEDLASAMHATTACSRPVADAHWRPHHEHVGQTGVAIRPNLYIAIGISGAIQHLAGVNNSKVIVVINKDPEAPFFKAADYGVVGDAFEIVPRLTEAYKKFKASQH
ncbi:MAG: electron transfer flavoprotein subunit alpha/FixB family protein [Saprospiraceae bacterium]